MANRVMHFEVPYDDKERAEEFYRQAFGWDVMEIPGFGGYAMATVGPTDQEKGPTEPGFINGALMQRTDRYATCDFVLGTDNIEESLEAVEKAGGQIVSRREAVGDMGFTGYVRDTEGNLVGLWEDAH